MNFTQCLRYLLAVAVLVVSDKLEWQIVLNWKHLNMIDGPETCVVVVVTARPDLDQTTNEF